MNEDYINDDRYWSSAEEHDTGRCLTKLCLYCAANGFSVEQQRQTRELAVD